MKLACPLALSLLFLSVAFAEDSDEGHPHVTTKLGEIEGVLLKTHEGKTVEAFLGVPYAKPPIGDLRFKAPVGVEKFESTLKAVKQPPSCFQASLWGPNKAGIGDYMAAHSEESEDCLYLNIYVPHPRPVNASVMVFVHGGAFMLGSANMEKYDPRELVADEGIIAVNINYRLSALGLLYMGCEEAPGNQALLDTRLALKFVRKHIENFGGHSRQVTLVGEGSGAFGAGLLMLSHTCTCLFQKLVLLNSSPLNVFSVHSKKEAEGISDRLASKLGCGHIHSGDHKEILECLRGKTAEDIIHTAEAMFRDMGLFFPVVDGNFLPHHPRVLAKQGAFDTSIPVILGASHHRASPINFLTSPLKPDSDSYISKNDMRSLVKDVLRSKSDFEINSILFHYTNFTHPHDPEAIRESSLDLTTDALILCPLNKFADELAYSGNDVYMFHIKHHPSKSKYPEFAGNLEGEDIDFFLGNVHPDNGYTDLDHRRAHHMMSHLSHFIKTGDPNLSEEDRHFPSYNLRTKAYLDIREGGTHGHFLRAQQCAFFDHAFSRVKYAAAMMASQKC